MREPEVFKWTCLQVLGVVRIVEWSADYINYNRNDTNAHLKDSCIQRPIQASHWESIILLIE